MTPNVDRNDAMFEKTLLGTDISQQPTPMKSQNRDHTSLTIMKSKNSEPFSAGNVSPSEWKDEVPNDIGVYGSHSRATRLRDPRGLPTLNIKRMQQHQ